MKSKFTNIVLLILFSMNVNAQELKSADVKDIVLFPQQNEFRNTLNLSGIWKFEKDQWFNGLEDCRSW